MTESPFDTFIKDLRQFGGLFLTLSHDLDPPDDLASVELGQELKRLAPRVADLVNKLKAESSDEHRQPGRVSDTERSGQDFKDE